MAHFERGVYEPNEDIRVFDGSEDDDDVEGSRLPLLIVLALLVLAMFGGVVWLAYTQGVARGRTETPVLTAQNGPARTAPANAGGAEQPYKGFKIYEQPAPPDDESAATTTTPGNPALKPATMAANPAPPPVVAKPTTPPPAAAPKVAAAIPAPAPKTVAAPPPPAPKPAASQPAAAPKVAAVTPKPAPPKPASTLPPATPAGPATSAPRSLASAAPAAPAPKPAAVVAASGAFALQIGSYPNQADAENAWKSYKAKHSALLSDAGYEVKQADLGAKGTWYRLRLVGYPSKDVASAMCDRLKSDGGACIPAQ